jgi:hypothetical protein
MEGGIGGRTAHEHKSRQHKTRTQGPKRYWGEISGEVGIGGCTARGAASFTPA